MEVAHPLPRLIEGVVRMHRVGGLGFPSEELIADGGRLARLGRDSSLWIFLGPGRRVLLSTGAQWRIKATTMGRYVVPIVSSPAGTIAFAGSLDGSRTYGITGKDFAYTLYPLGRPGWRRVRSWEMRRHDEQVASIDSSKRVLEAVEPISLGAVLLAFTLITHGVPGEGGFLPAYY